MCEFTVYLNGVKVMVDVVFAHDNGKDVTLKDIMGESKTFEGARIIKVNVLTTQLSIES